MDLSSTYFLEIQIFLRQHNKEDAKDWIINNQLGRRNLTDHQRSYLIGLQYKKEKNKVGTPEGRKNALKINVAETTHFQTEPVTRTSERLGKQHKVSERTIREDAHFADAIDSIAKNVGEEVKEKILAREIAILELTNGCMLKIDKGDYFERNDGRNDTKAN